MTNDTKTKENVTEPKNVAFALGGFGGNNAHGAGFLQAALDAASLDATTKPNMITFTSGQIYWVFEYLKALPKALNGSLDESFLRKKLKGHMDEAEPFASRDLNLMTLGWIGRPGHIRPPYREFFVDFITNAVRGFERVIEDPKHAFFTKELLDTIPARQLVMDFPGTFFETIADTFNKCDIGLAFNSFDPGNGTEVVHLNKTAQDFVGKKPGDRRRLLRERTVYNEITRDCVRDGLWLYQYGLEDNSKVDGAYYRQIMLDELMPATDVFVARPISQKWLGNMPSCWTEVEDLKYEVFFNGSYQGERDKLLLVNKLIEDGVIKDKRYRKVNLHEIEMETQEGFFEIVFENIDVFDRARNNAKKAFADYLGLQKAA
jgi:hypothetical protein